MTPPVLDRVVPTPRVRDGLILSGGPIRLNLGGIGDDDLSRIQTQFRTTRKLEGFLIVDIQDHPDVDVQSDVSDLSLFEDGSVSEIYASNVLEHFPHPETVKVLKEWRRVLKKGANCWVSVPDMDACFRVFQKCGLVPWVVNLIWGDQVHPYAYHYINFTFATLGKALIDAGFSDVKRLHSMPFGLVDASAHCDNQDFKLISLNVQAIA